MKFITVNTWNNKQYIYKENEVENLFSCNTFQDKFEYIDDMINYIKTMSNMRELKDALDYYYNSSKEIIFDRKEYLKTMIEYEQWTSPRGIESLYKVVDIIE